jgi:hypothetical protein
MTERRERRLQHRKPNTITKPGMLRGPSDRPLLPIVTRPAVMIEPVTIGPVGGKSILRWFLPTAFTNI